MTARTPIAADPPGDVRYAHLQPIVDAELSWGNAHGGWSKNLHTSQWWDSLRDRPDVARIRATFELPPTIVIIDRPDVVAVSDLKNEVEVRWSRPEQGDGLLKALTGLAGGWRQARRSRQANRRISDALERNRTPWSPP